MSKLQIVALVILTTILTDKFLINHNTNAPVQNPVIQNVTVAPTPTTNQIGTTSSLQATTQVGSTSTQPTTQLTTQNELILKEIQNLRNDMIQAKSVNQDTGTTLRSSLIGGMVKINSPQWDKVDVHEKPSASSKVINSIVYDAIYFYTSKTTDWYQLNLDGGQVGWVQAQFLKEYP